MKNIKIHTIENISGGWYATFSRTSDSHLEIEICPRHNAGMNQTIRLLNVNNNELLALAEAIQNKLSLGE